MKKLVLTLLILIFFPFLFLFQPWVFLPHNHIVISLPFAPASDQYTSLIPMGEMIEHNKENGNPEGHPGIDFGFTKITQILSSSNGVVTGIRNNKDDGYDVVVNSGFYKVEYKELNSLDKDLKLFKRVKIGDRLGYAGVDGVSEQKPKPEDPSRQVHWEFKSGSMFLDRLCPVNYFDLESKSRIEKIWKSVPENDQFKKLYPDICNGVFKDKQD